MSPSPETPVGRKRPRTRSSSQRVVDPVDNCQPTQHQRVDREWSSIPDLTENSSDEGYSEQVSFYDIRGDYNMPYPYSKYRDGVHAKSHIRYFLTTWEINHGA